MRAYDYLVYYGMTTPIEITMDASPWGLGAFLRIDYVVVSYIVSALDQHDLQIFGYELGDAAGQQTWECLIALVALRAWHQYWSNCTACLAVRSDSMGALYMLLKMKSKGHGPGLIARELALTLGDSVYIPRILAHSPGLANQTADALSRRFQPQTNFRMPACLSAAQQTHVPIRDRRYFKSLVSTDV
jgi:hypothetical protein